MKGSDSIPAGSRIGRIVAALAAIVMVAAGLSLASAGVASAQQCASDRLPWNSDQVIDAGTLCLKSADGSRTLNFQEDGNLVASTGGSPEWDSGTVNTGRWLVLGAAGSLLIADHEGVPRLDSRFTGGWFDALNVYGTPCRSTGLHSYYLQLNNSTDNWVWSVYAHCNGGGSELLYGVNTDTPYGEVTSVL